MTDPVTPPLEAPLHIIFDGPPGPDGPRFIEVETPDGKSVNAGEWQERPDGYWALILKGAPLKSPLAHELEQSAICAIAEASLPSLEVIEDGALAPLVPTEGHGAAVLAVRQCKYCGPGMRTGLPGNACENCMGAGEDLEGAAWSWVQSRYPNDTASDLAFDADEMVDAYIAGASASQQAAVSTDTQVGTEAQPKCTPSLPGGEGGDLREAVALAAELNVMARHGRMRPGHPIRRAAAVLELIAAARATEQAEGVVVGNGPLSDLVMVKAPLRPTPAMIDAANEKSDARGRLRQGPEQVWRDMMQAWIATPLPNGDEQKPVGEGGDDA